VGGNLQDWGGGDDCGEVGGVKIPWAKVCMANKKTERVNSCGMEIGSCLSGPNKNRNEIWPFPMGGEKRLVLSIVEEVANGAVVVRGRSDGGREEEGPRFDKW
jgi:hypothetical protein